MPIQRHTHTHTRARSSPTEPPTIIYTNAGCELHQWRTERGRSDGRALEHAHHPAARGGNGGRNKVSCHPLPIIITNTRTHRHTNNDMHNASQSPPQQTTIHFNKHTFKHYTRPVLLFSRFFAKVNHCLFLYSLTNRTASRHHPTKNK